jgi:hypothetical protein
VQITFFFKWDPENSPKKAAGQSPPLSKIFTLILFFIARS